MSIDTPSMSLEERESPYMRRERFEINQYVRVRVTDTRYSIGVVTDIDEDQDRATVETRNGYEVTVPLSALRRAFLLVLDLNGVLVARGRGSFVLRPNVVDFLKFVFSNFVVAVWTSGLQRSSDPIIDHVFGNYRDLLLFTFFRDACVPKPSAENPYGTEKNLQVIFDRYPQSFHSVNTIIIDDSPDKCSHPDIALCPIPFKDPVGQVDDEGLMQTMEVLKEVLRLDSGTPLILAAERRLEELAKQQQEACTSGEANTRDQKPWKTSTSTVKAAAPAPAEARLARVSVSNSHAIPSDMEEVELWKTRLCCDKLQGKCSRGDQCPFSHDVDDGRPCSRKSGCRHHGARWRKTHEEAQLDEQSREKPKAMHQHYEVMQQQRKPQLRRPKGPPRQGGQADRPRRRDDDGDDDGAEWARGTIGLSHTGDPLYDNEIDAKRRQEASTSKATTKALLAVTTGATSRNAPRGSSAKDNSTEKHQRQYNQLSSSAALFFQTNATSSAVASHLEPFSTRPIPPTVFSTAMSTHPQQQQQRTGASLNRTNASVGREKNGDDHEHQRSSGSRQQQRERDSVQQQRPQSIHITGKQGDSTAVVSQLRALMHQR